MMQRKQNSMVALTKILTCFEIVIITVIAMGCPLEHLWNSQEPIFWPST